MVLNGLHHITAITGNAPQNVDFYTRVLGMRLVKKTVNQDDPSVYHLFYGDEEGHPGFDLTFFEYRHAAPGRAGDGMVHRVLWRLASTDALDFWAARLGGEGVDVDKAGAEALRFRDPEGLQHELAVAHVPDSPLVAEHPDIPTEMALQGFAGVRAYSSAPEQSRHLLENGLGFSPTDDGWEVRGHDRGATYAYDPPPPSARRVQGAGSIHHVAWCSGMDEHPAWQAKVDAAGGQPTPVIDRFYFRSIYFFEPSHVLFEIATDGPGFTADEPLETLGERLSLPPIFEPLRERLGDILTPLPPLRDRAGRS
jgi:glyoxalase family protein